MHARLILALGFCALIPYNLAIKACTLMSRLHAHLGKDEQLKVWAGRAIELEARRIILRLKFLDAAERTMEAS